MSARFSAKLLAAVRRQGSAMMSFLGTAARGEFRVKRCNFAEDRGMTRRGSMNFRGGQKFTCREESEQMEVSRVQRSRQSRG